MLFCIFGRLAYRWGVEIIHTDRHRHASKDELKSFLEGIHDSASDQGQEYLVSIVLQTDYLDPLGVLSAIYEADEPFMFVEQPMREFAVAGAEGLALASFKGEERFQQARDFARDLSARTIVIGDTEDPLARPVFFCAFTFDAESAAEPGEAFAAATVFVPQWQVMQTDGRFFACANVLVGAETDTDAVTNRIWAAHDRFESFDYSTLGPGEVEKAPASILRRRELCPDPSFEDRVKTGLRQIEEGLYEKIVLARALDLEIGEVLNPLDVANRLRDVHPRCSIYAFQNQHGRSFVGASPERLVSGQDGRLEVDAVAGSRRRGPSAREDAAFSGELLESEKDLREHQHVVDAIVRRLDPVARDLSYSDTPSLMRLSNVQHLCTSIRAQVRENTHILDVAGALHPTPAVGGSPRDQAVPRIRDLEGFDRGLFAGVLGWFSGETTGELIVGLRCAELSPQKTLRVYAGAGIVRGSVPLHEREETEVKMRALLESLPVTKDNHEGRSGS